jgi:glycosyltransferase involved in cell wall biosynthesis
MKILLFSYYDPLGKGGFEKQIRGLIKTLIRSGHQIACLTITDPKNVSNLKANLESSQLFELGIWILPYEEEGYSLIARFLFWLSSNPAKFLAQQHPGLLYQSQDKLFEISKISEIDIIHCLGLRTSYFLPDKSSIPIVLDLVDSFTQHKKRAIKYYLKSYSIIKLALAVFDFLKTRRIEQSILSTYDNALVSVVSSKDASVLKALSPRSSIYVTSHPVDIDILEKSGSIAPTDKPEDQPDRIIFYGFMEQLWNIDALRFLIYEILPIVYRNYSNIQLSITGFNIPDEIFKLSSQFDWISVNSSVENISSFLDSATLTCWPFRYGSGFKNKILESMVFGKAVVTTTLGAEAFTEQQKQGLLIDDTAEGLAQKIIFLLKNSNERLRLGEINRQIALNEFSWKKKTQDYLRLYSLAIEAFGRASVAEKTYY